ncbi:hypothetical protein KIN20_019413 [Parelaphostrongylus tenuis]|uniref:Uncharacterized protein n=1 Tax=Parelaphostrongylus tenuis TaxID=148309 RepID=A0AAD5QSW9_PARTN|nr:hypothetical protein KIN20_019413 [Parelaphostrongylus tenuis]
MGLQPGDDASGNCAQLPRKSISASATNGFDYVSPVPASATYNDISIAIAKWTDKFNHLSESSTIYKGDPKLLSFASVSTLAECS